MLRFIVRRLIGMGSSSSPSRVLVFLIFQRDSQLLAGRAPRRQERDAGPGQEHREEWGFDESLPAQYYQMMKRSSPKN